MKILAVFVFFTLFLAMQAHADEDAAPVDCSADPSSCQNAPPPGVPVNCDESAGALTLEDAQTLLQNDINACNDNKTNAESCCTNPAACNGGAGGGSDMSQLMKMMMTVSSATLLAQSSPDQMASMSQICGMFGGMNTAGATVNANTAQACNSEKQQCSDYCSTADANWQMLFKCDKVSKEVKNWINQHRGPLASAVVRCNALNSTALKAQSMNQASAGNGSMQNVCNQLAQQQQQAQLTPVTAPNIPDCTNPLLANTNVCVVCGSDPTSTACQQAITDSAGANAGFQPASALNGNNSNNFNAGDPGTIAQNAQFPDNNNQNGINNNNTNPYGMGGGGGGLMPSSSSGGSATPPARRGYGRGYNTDVLKGNRGVSGINGLGGSMAVDTSGGFSGYGGSAQAPHLDLKNYLPGRRLYAGRKIAGVGSPNPDINPQGTDLFKRISDRFKVICSLNRLVDCNPGRVPNKTGM